MYVTKYLIQKAVIRKNKKDDIKQSKMANINSKFSVII